MWYYVKLNKGENHFLFGENSQIIEVKNNEKERGKRCLVQKIFK